MTQAMQSRRRELRRNPRGRIQARQAADRGRDSSFVSLSGSINQGMTFATHYSHEGPGWFGFLLILILLRPPPSIKPAASPNSP